MNKKQIVILAVVLGVLILGVAVRSFIKPRELATEMYEPLDLAFDAAPAARIKIRKGAQAKPLELVRENGVWTVPAMWKSHADPEKISQFISSIQKAQGELRARSRDLFGDFGIRDEEAYRVSILAPDGRELMSFLAGTVRANPDSVFLRRPGSEFVFLAAFDFFRQIGLQDDPKTAEPAPDFWIALKFASLKIDDISRLEISRFSKSGEIPVLGVERLSGAGPTAGTPAWKSLLAAPVFEISGEKVLQFFDRMRDWQARQALDPGARDYGFAKPAWRLTARTIQNEEIVIAAGAKEEKSGNYFVRVSTHPAVFEIPPRTFEEMNVDQSVLFKDNPLEIDAVTVEKITVRTGQAEISIGPQEADPQAWQQYLDRLEKIAVTRLLFDAAEKKKAASPGREWIGIRMKNRAPLFLDIGEPLSADQKEYAALKRGSAQPFAIPGRMFKALFEGLENLKKKS